MDCAHEVCHSSTVYALKNSLGEEGIHWPCHEPSDEGDSFHYEDWFTTESGRGQIEVAARVTEDIKEGTVWMTHPSPTPRGTA